MGVKSLNACPNNQSHIESEVAIMLHTWLYSVRYTRIKLSAMKPTISLQKIQWEAILCYHKSTPYVVSEKKGGQR